MTAQIQCLTMPDLAERVCQASGGDLGHWVIQRTHSGLQEQGVAYTGSPCRCCAPAPYQSCREHLSVAATPNRQFRDSTSQAPAPPEGHINQLASLYTQNAGNKPAKKAFRAVPSAPERILDAPDLMDDYYLNLLDWSSTNVVSACIALSILEAFRRCFKLCTAKIWFAGLS